MKYIKYTKINRILSVNNMHKIDKDKNLSVKTKFHHKLHIN